MRKSFTQLIGIFMLMMVFVLQSFADVAVFPTLGSSADFTNQKKTEALVLTASKAVVPGTGVVRLKDDGGAVLGAYQATNSNVVIAAKGDGTYTISINFSSLLTEGDSYTLEADANFVKAGDDSAPSAAGSWTVTVGDYTAPVLASPVTTTSPLAPKNGATSVQLMPTPLAPNPPLVVTFNESINVINGSQVFIYTDNGTTHGDLYDVVTASNLAGASMIGGIAYPSGDQLIIYPNKPFVQSTKYYVVLPEGVVIDQSENDNKFAGWLDNTSWVFTTRDATAPVVKKAVADNIAKDAFDVILQLDKPGKVYVYAVAKDAAAPTRATVIGSGVSKTVAAALTDVSISLDGFTEGNSYDVYVVTENAETIDPTQSDPAKELTVTTADVTAPVVASYYPAAGSLAADVNTKDSLKIYVTEANKIKVGTGSINVYTWDNSLNHELFVSVPASSCKVVNHTDAKYLAIPVSKSSWVSSTTYFVKYDEGVLTDMAGNKLAALTSTDGWKFTVADFLAPTYTIVPTDGTMNASETAPQVTITFDEALYKDDAGTPMDEAGILSAITIQKGTSAVTYTVNSFDGKVIKLDLGTVASNDAFEVTIDTKKIFDASGNAGTTSDVIKFSIKDFQAPVVTIVPPTPGASDNILVKFDEPVFNADGSAITDADVANMVIFRKGTSASGAIVTATYSVAADAKSFIINPANDFTTPGDQYYVRLGAGAVKDAAGNANALAEATLTVADFIAPTASFSGIGTSPVNPTAVSAVITFSEPMATLDGTAVAADDDATELINLKEAGENMSLYSAKWTSATTIAITATYGYNKTYAISVGKSLEDLAGNAFAGTSTSFTTWSDVAPVKVSVTPTDGATEQANDAAVSVTFDQNIVAGTGTATVVGSTSGDVTGSATISGSKLTIAHTAFVTDETVTVTVPAGYITNANGDGNAAVTWSFKTKDTTAPTATYAPTGAGAAIDAKLVLTFNENIVKKTGTIYIKNAANDVTVQSLTEANAVVKSDNKTLEVTPVANLEYGKTYYVVVSSGIVTDAAGNPYAGVTNPATWSFTTATTPGAFTVASSVPADGADMIAAGISSITVTFNRAILAGSLSSVNKITLSDGSATPVISDVANSGRFTISGSTLTINTLNDIVANKTYTLTLDGGIVKDNYNTDNTGKVITFYTFDHYGPKVVSHTPATDATGVSASTTVVINWDETPLLGTAAISAADIKANSLVTVNATTNYTASVNGLQWTLTLDAPLAEKTTYPVVVKQSAVKDAAGNLGGSDLTWSFTTADLTCHAPIASVPAAGVTGNDKGTEVTLSVIFDEKGTVYYYVLPASTTAPTAAEIIAQNKTLAYTASGSKTATVTGLTSGASYKVYAVAVDAVSNQSTVAAVAFTTADVVAPSVTAMVPANGAVDVAGDTTLKLTFDENIIVGTGYVVIRNLATDVVVASIPVSSASISGKTATFTTGVSLVSQTKYYVEVSSGAFTDAALNKTAGISGNSAWAFTIKDMVPPTLSSTTPDYTETTPEIKAGTTLSMTFSEPMKIGTGVLYVKYTADDKVFDVINASALTLSTDMKTISFKMSNVPTEQTTFYVDVTDLTLTDLAGNAWDKSEFEEDIWDFTILDQTAPALASSVPANNAKNVVINTPISLTFTEAIHQSPDATDFTATTIKDIISVKDAAGNAVALNSVALSVDMKTITIVPKNSLTSETTYTIYISPVVDSHKNVSSELTVTFATKDMTAPTAMWNPEFDTTMNPATGVVTVTFSEPIYDEATETAEHNFVLIDIVNANIPSFFTYNVGTIARNTDGDITDFTAGDPVGFTGSISADKKVITLTPVASAVPLASEAWYQVVLKPGVISDASANYNATDNTIFQIVDHEKPVVATVEDVAQFMPQGATEADAEMSITFSEDVKVGTGSFYIRNYEDGTLVEKIDAADVTAEGNKVVIAHADFPADMNFYVNADAGVVTDLAGNAWDGIASSAINTWKFSTADAVEPTLISGSALIPAPASTNVSLTADLQIIFSKEIAKGAGYIVIYNEDWTPFQVIDVTSSLVSLAPSTDPVYQENRIAVIAHNEFDPQSTYFVRVEKGVFTDTATPANLFAGLLDNTWTFTTEDNAAPAIVETMPAKGETGVSAYTDLTITFDRDVLANAAGKVYVYKEVNNEGTLVETIDPTDATKVSIDGAVVTIKRDVALEYNSDYYVIIEPGAFTNTASDKKPFEGIMTTQEWYFSTGGDIDAPTLTTATPTGTMAEGTHPTFVMTFSEDVVLGAGKVYVYAKDSTTASLALDITKATVEGNVVTLTYDYATSGGLDKATEYYVLVDSAAVKDVAGNAFVGVTDDTAWTFKTGPEFTTENKPVIGSLEFKVYPNPFVDYVTVANASQLTKIVVSNIAGQVVKEVVNPTDRIQLNELRSGVYFMSMYQSNSVVKTAKIIKR